MSPLKKDIPQLTNDEIRSLILKYFYDRAGHATSLRGKKGSSVKMKDIKAELKNKHNFNDAQIVSNLTYLLSQKWVQEEIEKKSFTTSTGLAVPSETQFYSISAAGTDKIEGPGSFTPERFSGINIDAVGSVITIGDGNQVNVKYKEIGQALSDLRKRISETGELNDEQKIDAVIDIDSIQDQLVKSSPTRSVIKTLWENIEKLAAVGSLTEAFYKASSLIQAVIS